MLDLGLYASRNRLRNASIGHSGASEFGCNPSYQCHDEMSASTDGSCATIEIGTSWFAPAPLTDVAGWWSPSRTSTRLLSCSCVTHEMRAVIEYSMDWPYSCRTVSVFFHAAAGVRPCAGIGSKIEPSQ